MASKKQAAVRAKLSGRYLGVTRLMHLHEQITRSARMSARQAQKSYTDEKAPWRSVEHPAPRSLRCSFFHVLHEMALQNKYFARQRFNLVSVLSSVQLDGPHVFTRGARSGRRGYSIVNMQGR